ncbi:hypothetical protein C464_14155 [Halorubrum coriense DSM 10284]|uniref:Uncharacterized protein n=1 Tax=Halorubrum coriense DSM 10284 TaxID=1227466 RepID=M0E832_9EURY|nr:hypothetical protein [Halorubrum coriense]ELZ43986.1 hypothetical protein C464_14155 [Halorubrum coriense DSM 10284]
MEPEEAVRQLEYSIDASLDEIGQRAAAGYRPTFERVAERADGAAVYDLAGELSQEVADGSCPSPSEANDVADRVLDDWAFTDGGE